MGTGIGCCGWVAAVSGRVGDAGYNIIDGSGYLLLTEQMTPVQRADEARLREEYAIENFRAANENNVYMKNDIETNLIPSKVLRILHITDLHYGLKGQEVYFPSFKNALLKDFRQIAIEGGAWDIVLFTGDLVQTGENSEYEALELLLLEFWKLFRELGFCPYLFAIPGNHDLTRSSPSAPVVKALSHWHSDSEIRQAFFDSKTPEYLEFVEKSFLNYESWWKSTAIPKVEHSNGLLPGDLIASPQINGLKLGIVGLNSTWLQLRAGDFRGKLHVDPRQLLQLTAEPDQWCQNNDFNVLVTHHPTDWLCDESVANWRTDVDCNARFDFHIFGHMHEARVSSLTEGGGNPRRALQGPSLFGLENFGEKGEERQTGYSLLELGISGDHKEIRYFPRKGIRINSGENRIVPDLAVGLENNSYLKLRYPHHIAGKHLAVAQSFDKQIEARSNKETLSHLVEWLPDVGAWKEVRHIEIEEAAANLREKRLLWVATEWGMAFEQFISSVKQELKVNSREYIRLQVNSLDNLETLKKVIQESSGLSLEKICINLSSTAVSILVFDDVLDLQIKSIDVGTGILKAIEVIKDYCPEIFIIIKSLNYPIGFPSKALKLASLDNVSCAAYVRKWKQGKYSEIDEASITRIFRISDGVPIRLEEALENYEIFGTTELGNFNSDLEGARAVTPENISPVVAAELDRLESGDPSSRQAYGLLCALAMFPQGESFETVKRFNESKPFYPQDVKFLIERTLVNSNQVSSLAGVSERLLVVPRLVREALYKKLSSLHELQLTSKSMNLYFGKDWRSKGFRSTKIKVHSPNCSDWKIINASTIVQREVRAAIRQESKAKFSSACAFSFMYCKALHTGNHFRSVVELIDEIIPLLEDANFSDNTIAQLRSLHVRSLRMIEQHLDSIDSYNKIDINDIPTDGRPTLILSYAWSLEATDQIDSAISAAKKVIDLDKRSGCGLQAKALLIRLENSQIGAPELLKFEKEATRKKHFVAAQNFAIARALKMDDKEAIPILKKVVDETRVKDDFYNSVRAAIHVAKKSISLKEEIDDSTYRVLLDGYHMLYSGGSSSIFKSINSALWGIFESKKDFENMLRLFRHSSLLWRLRNETKEESDYAELLMRLIEKRSASLINDHHAYHYALIRLGRLGLN
ncbi:putative MPP superfamily phosphohydrolase/tetratricopeptide (TPR) repeat protein [Xanthomonas arboricola]|nr:putative MPP superfamily phosphohydrolase/tetratricopeptide (TPR) repeat protein [Xanthomonas arboricola]